MLVAHVRGEVERVLGVASGRGIEDSKGFFQLGMDSIMTVELRSRLQEGLGCDLPVTVAFEYPNVVALAGFIAGELGLQPLQPTAAGVTEPSDVRMDELAGRSDDELAALLDSAIAGSLGAESGEQRS